MTARTMQKENDEAMDEIRESAQKILNSVVNISKTVDWKSVLPKVIVGLVVLYGLRNRTMLKGIVTSMAVGLMSSDLTSKLTGSLKKAV